MLDAVSPKRTIGDRDGFTIRDVEHQVHETTPSGFLNSLRGRVAINDLLRAHEISGY